MPREIVVTPEGLDKLKDELERLRTNSRQEIAERIKEAREFGDIAENAEYDAAKNDQAMLEARIAQLEDKLRAVRVLDGTEEPADIVHVGSIVHVKDQKSAKSAKYMIVGSAEANPAENKLSNESPVGKAMMGHKRNDVVSVPVPRGPARKLKITKIEVAKIARRKKAAPKAKAAPKPKAAPKAKPKAAATKAKPKPAARAKAAPKPKPKTKAAAKSKK